MKPQISQRIFVPGGIALFCLLATIASPFYSGSIVNLLAFDAAFLGLLLLALPQPRVYGYTSFVVFLFLGFWAKLTAHLILSYPFLEPTGDFDGGAESWDRALMVATVAALGVMAARFLYLLLVRLCLPQHEAWKVHPVTPAWYLANPALVWGCAILLTIALNAWNFYAAFYQIGVNPKVVLPFHLNVGAAWLINIGFGLVFATLVQWELARPRANPGVGVLVAVVEACMSSITSLSRSIFVLRILSYFLVLLNQWHFLRGMLGRRGLFTIGAASAFALVVTLTLVTWARLQVFPPIYTLQAYSESKNAVVTISPLKSADIDTAVSESETVRALKENMVRDAAAQLTRLLIDRWIGLEGMMAVSSYKRLGTGLLVDAFQESPQRGNEAVYQIIAKASYKPSKEFTFLTLPGIAAILYYSGSLITVWIGIVLVTGVMLFTEVLTLRFIGGDFIAAVSGVAVANVVCQLNFPYLGMVFFVELWATLFFIWLLQVIPFHAKPKVSRAETTSRAA